MLLNMTNLESYNCAKRKGLKHSKVLVWIGICQGIPPDQGPKLTFLGRRQLVTKNLFLFFHLWLPKSVNKIFFAAKHKPKCFVIRWKILFASFSFKNQKKENAFGATVVIFLPTKKIKYKHAVIIYTPTIITEKPRQTNQMSSIYPEVNPSFCFAVLILSHRKTSKLQTVFEIAL